MKFRFTPLNLFTAFLVAVAAYVFIYGAGIAGRPLEHWGGIIGWIFLLFALVVFVIDIMFRNFFIETKKIWMVETFFIVLVIIIFLLVK
ncbi:hypothetical protein ACFFGT_07540 [Mucilaginibacter angelicae]|uniref:Uncharacterized protein n=1 Tax=Mucilaginibacter angelicae TaxID=869718 RepID=A0ABV6L3L1_9SPHI